MSSSEQEKYPDFFKVYLPHLCSHNMKIPDAFIERLNEEIPKQVLLRSRVGELWVVEVAKKEDGMFIQQGWSRLVLDKSLEAGDILLFKYNGHHLFDIIIFGPTGCEKEQLCSSATQQQKSVEQLCSSETQQQKSVEQLCSSPTQQQKSVEQLCSSETEQQKSVEQLCSSPTQQQKSVEQPCSSETQQEKSMTAD